MKGGRACAMAFLLRKTAVGGCPVGTILIEVPEECKGLADRIREFVAKVMSGRKRGVAGGRSVDYGAIEVSLGEAAAKVESDRNLGCRSLGLHGKARRCLGF